ncbi:MAG: YceI family protein [Actinomycetota bacterium]
MSLPTGKAFTALIGVGVLAAYGSIYTLVIEPQERERLASETLLAADSDSTESVIDLRGDWEIASGSQISYRLRHHIPNITVPMESVGKTQAVEGEMTVEYQRGNYVISDLSVEVDMTKVVDDAGTQGLALYSQSLEPDRYPSATFSGDTPIIVPRPQVGSDTVAFYFEGALTAHGITRQVSIPVQARLSDRQIEAEGSLLFPMADFGITPPTSSDEISAEPNGTLEFRLLLEKAG